MKFFKGVVEGGQERIRWGQEHVILHCTEVVLRHEGHRYLCDEGFSAVLSEVDGFPLHRGFEELLLQ